MSSPLDRIEARAKEAAEALRFDGLGIGYEHMGDMHRDFVPLVRDVLALVNVAKAAETVWTSIGHAAWCGSIEGEPCDCGQTALREALAVLNKEPA